jgi:glycosyltransferase involved in cell wall biosynthesis
MYEGNTISVVIPAYNEEGYVGEVIDTIPAFVDRVYVVDDGSTDGTWTEIQAHARAYNAKYPPETTAFGERVVPIQHERNRGVGGAIKTGYQHALADEIDVTTVMGGDGQMDPEVLTLFIRPIVEGRADYTKGNRFMREDDLDAMPRFRLVGNAVLSLLTKIASGYWKISDPQNGYTAISREALERIDLDGMYEYYGYCNDLLVKLNAEDLRVADIAHSAETVYDEEDWKSHIKYDEYIPKVSMMLLRNFFWRLNRKYLVRDFNPLAFLYYFGAGVSVVGLAGVANALRGRRESTGSWFASAALGASLLFLAMVFDMEENREKEVLIEDIDDSPTNADEPEPRDTGATSVVAADDD